MFRRDDRDLLRSTASAVGRIEGALSEIEAMLRQGAAREGKIMATLDETLAEATRATTVGTSVVALCDALKGQLDAALAGSLTPAQQAKVDAIFGALKGNDDAVEAAVLRDTPQAAPTS